MEVFFDKIPSDNCPNSNQGEKTMTKMKNLLNEAERISKKFRNKDMKADSKFLEKIKKKKFSSFFNKKLFFAKFSKIFKVRSKTPPTISEYFDRINSYGQFPEEVLLLTGLLLIQTIFCPKSPIIEKELMIKLFATCLNISQKLIMDICWDQEDFAKLVGFKRKSLRRMEIFLSIDLFEGNIPYSHKDIKEFKEWLNFEDFIEESC